MSENTNAEAIARLRAQRLRCGEVSEADGYDNGKAYVLEDDGGDYHAIVKVVREWNDSRTGWACWSNLTKLLSDETVEDLDRYLQLQYDQGSPLNGDKFAKGFFEGVSDAWEEIRYAVERDEDFFSD